MLAVAPPDKTVRVGEASPPGLREKLKAATATAHRALDGNGLPLWRTSLDTLEGETVTPDGEAKMIAGAQRAFAMFARAARAGAGA
jgi:heme oxygenase